MPFSAAAWERSRSVTIVLGRPFRFIILLKKLWQGVVTK